MITLPYRIAVVATVTALLLLGSRAIVSGADPVPGSCMGDPARIIENLGQWDSPAKFYLGDGPCPTAFDEDGVRVLLNAGAACAARPGALVRLRFVNGVRDSTIRGEHELPGRHHYFLGNDPSRWRSHVRSYSRVRYSGIFEGVDVVFRTSEENTLAYDLHLEPGADLTAIRVECLGIEGLSLAEDGALVLGTAAGPLSMSAPVAWQVGEFGERRPLECAFELRDERCFGFRAVSCLNPALPLCIDPVMEFASYLGGDKVDWAEGIATSLDGSTVVAGVTCTPDIEGFPITPGAFDTLPPTIAIECCAFVTRFAPDGSSLEFSTYFGGSRSDEAMDVKLDAVSQELVVVGYSTSSDMPTTSGAYSQVHANPNTTFARSRDVFVARFSADGASLVYSTFLGGTDSDKPWGMALSAGGEVVVVGETDSPDFPLTPNAPDTTTLFMGCSTWGDEGFVARLSADGSMLLSSTYIGGSDAENVWDVDLDAAGAIYICGETGSQDFPVTAGAFDDIRSNPPCSTAGFVMKLTPSGDAIERSTLLENGVGWVGLVGLRLDLAGRPIVVGTAVGPGLPTTADAYRATAIEDGDGVLASFDPTLSQLEYCTYFGSSQSGTGQGGYDQPKTVGLLSTGEVAIAGNTNGMDFPVTSDALQPNFGGTSGVFGEDGFLLVFDPATPGPAALTYSTYLGGASWDSVLSLSVDPQDRIAASLRTQSQTTLSGTPGAFMENGHLGAYPDAYVLRLRLTEAEFRRGDANGDGSMNIADAISVLGALFAGGQIDCRDASDANDDGANDIADAVFVLSALFSQGSNPPDPGALICGTDPTADGLGCIQHPSCP